MHNLIPISNVGPTVVWEYTIFNADRSNRAFRGDQGKSLRELRPINDLPQLCIYNGHFVDPDDMDWIPSEIDHVKYISVPKGGNAGASQAVLGIVLIVVGAYTGNGMLITQGAGFLIGGLAATGNKPTSLTPSADSGSPSPTYNLQLSGNVSRLGEPLPVVYGTHILMPDFASQPYSEYDTADDQYYHAVLVFGEAIKYTVERVDIDDTSLSHFQDVSTQYFGDAFSSSLTLVELGVVNAPEVANNDLKYGGYVGPFAVCGPGLECSYIGYDIALPKGLFTAELNGDLSPRTVSWFVEVRAIGPTGAPTGGWTLLSSESITAATNKPIRRSYKIAVASGRYECRVSRTNAAANNNRANDDLQWIGLRAYLTGLDPIPSSINGLAIKIRASSQLSGLTQRRISVVLSVWLPTWSQAGGWTAPVKTSSIAWVLADILRNGLYGPTVPDNRIDLITLEALNIEWAARGDTFNAVFDKLSTVWQALTVVARVGRARPVMRGNVYTFVRDDYQTLPSALFTMRNIVKGSFNINYTLVDDDSFDQVQVEYFDSKTWSSKSVSVPIPGAATTGAPYKVSLIGIDNLRHATREALATAAAIAYRPATISFKTELEAHLPGIGRLVAISHDLIGIGSSGEILAWTSPIATCSERIAWTVGTNYAILNDQYGDVHGPYRVQPGPQPFDMVFIDLPAGGIIDASTNRELTRYSVGPGTAYTEYCKIVSITPSGKEIEIRAIIEDQRVHSADIAFIGPEGGSEPGSGTRYGRYAPDTVPTYSAASDFERSRYGFYADDNLKVGITDEGYKYDA